MPELTDPDVLARGDRPFPWRCFECGQEAVTRVTMEHVTEVLHDGSLHRVRLAALRVPRCSACGELAFDNEADEQISAAARNHLRLLTPEQIVAGRESLGLRREQLAGRLGIADGTLGRWEDGLVLQPRAMDNLMRVFFGIPEVRAALVGAGQDPALGACRG